jgi:hypothetical protein
MTPPRWAVEERPAATGERNAWIAQGGLDRRAQLAAIYAIGLVSRALG